MQRNVEKCREIQRNAEKFREMQRKSEKCMTFMTLLTFMTQGNVIVIHAKALPCSVLYVEESD